MTMWQITEKKGGAPEWVTRVSLTRVRVSSTISESTTSKSSSAHHSPSLDVGLVVSTVALSAVLQPSEGEPGPGAHQNINIIDNIILI